MARLLAIGISLGDGYSRYSIVYLDYHGRTSSGNIRGFMAGFSEFGPGGDTHHLIALREDCDSRDAAPEVQLAIDVAS